MKLLKTFAALLALLVVLYACRKERSAEGGEIPGPVENTWQFTEAGVTNQGLMDSAYVQTVGNVSTLSIVGSSAEKQGEIFLQIVTDSIALGTYSNPIVFYQYGENGTVVFQSSPVQTGSFSIVITELDSSMVAGTFTGTVLDAQGNEHLITDGKFRSIITTWQDNEQPIFNGQLTVWAKQVCEDGGAIEIKINGQTASIADGLTAEPLCGAEGTAVFTLPTGTYTLEAICGADTLRYEVSIAGECTLLEIDFGNPPVLDDYLPLVAGSYWGYTDMGNPANTQRITSDGQETIEGRMFTRMVSTIGDTFYYRKEQNVYFQYRTLDFQGFVNNPPSIEVPILYDNLDAGNTWETQPELIDLAGVPVTAKIVFTINRRDFQASFNGVNYSDLIEVNTEIFFSSDGGTNYQTSGVAYNTVFAKGKGIVYYYDIDRDVEWAINEVFLNP